MNSTISFDVFKGSTRVRSRWVDGKWRFYEGAIRDFDESGSIQMTPFKEMEFPMKENWESFQKTSMGFR